MKLKPIYQLLLLICITLGVYYPTIFAPLNSLDDQLLVDQLLNSPGFSFSRHFSPGGTYDYFRPLLTLTFEIDNYIGGLQEPFMHLLNILIHTLNVVLLWFFARSVGRLLDYPSEWPPLVAALLFALHPINTEAVNWIMGRTDLLAGTFVFLALISLLLFVEKRSLIWGACGTLALLLGALCKETALFLIPAAFFLLLCRPVSVSSDWQSWHRRWFLPIFYGAATVGYFVLRKGAFHVDRGLGHTAKLLDQATAKIVAVPTADAVTAIPFPWFDAIRIVVKASGFYAVKLFQPLPLNFAIHKVGEIYLVPGVILLVALAILVWRRQLQGWLFLASAAIATSALFVLFTGLAWTPIAERYMYIPSGPFVVGLVYAAGSSFGRLVSSRTAGALIIMLFVVAAWATFARNLVWQDNLTLYQDAVRQSPEFAPAKNQLALALYAHNRPEEARTLLLSNTVQKQDQTAMNRAAVYWQQGDFSAARAELLRNLQNTTNQHLRIQILEKLVGMTLQQAQTTRDDVLKCSYYADTLGWLEQIRTMTPSGFLSYRIGRVHLLLNNRAEAQQAFSEAAENLPANSIYKEPAAKLARNLAQ